MRDAPEIKQTASDAASLEQAEQPGAPTPTDTTTAAEPIASLEELLKKAELAAEEHHDAWLRAKAEADNIRKRAQVEVANAHKFAVENFASELLPVKDSLEAALTTETAALESVKSGVALTLKQLNSVFEKFSLAEINPVGDKFDPHHHQAITTVESEAEPNTVVQVLQKGYRLHERVVRPALVAVAKAKTVEN